jgi:hypothetical protein
VNRLTITLVDLFEILSATQMWPGEFGVASPAADSEAQVFFEDANFDDRIKGVLFNAGIQVEWYIVFSGNVELHEAAYSPGESAMTAIQEAADAEFPGVSNAYIDVFGRLAAHGRLAKFDPFGTQAGMSDPSDWYLHHWKVGDSAAVASQPTQVAQIRQFGFSRDLSKVINSGSAYPKYATDAQIKTQLVKDTTSIGKYGIRSWGAENLLTKRGLPSPTSPETTDLQECLKFADYYVQNYNEPIDRISSIGLRSMRPVDPHADPLWSLLCQIDIADVIDVSVGSPGGGGFNFESYFVEGIHEQARPLGFAYDDVTMTLDLSPRSVFDYDPWA